MKAWFPTPVLEVQRGKQGNIWTQNYKFENSETDEWQGGHCEMTNWQYYQRYHLHINV